MELFNTGLVSVLLLKAYSKSLFPDRMTPGQNKKKKKRFVSWTKQEFHYCLYYTQTFIIQGNLVCWETLRVAC